MSDELIVWTIYQGTSDVPAPFCVRPWRVLPGRLVPVRDAIPAATLDAARAEVPSGLHRMPRSPGDDTVIVESWL